MTTPTPDSIAADATVYGQVQNAAGRATQQQADQQVISSLQSQIAALQSQIAELEAELAALQPPPPAPAPSVLFGASVGGWSIKNKVESLAAAHARIRAGFGGVLPVVRAWPHAGSASLGEYADDTCKRYLIEVPQGSTPDQVDVQVQGAPAGSILVAWHEPENDGTNAATWQAFVTMVGARIVASGRTDIDGAVILMGATYHPTRYKDTGGNPWTYWIPAELPPGITMLGGDMYPRGATDATADTAATVLQPALDAANKYDVPFAIGELGCGKPQWSDAVRAKYTADAVAFIRANANRFPVVSFFESDSGGQGPWCVLPNPKTGQPILPLTVAVVKEAVSGG